MRSIYWCKAQKCLPDWNFKPLSNKPTRCKFCWKCFPLLNAFKKGPVSDFPWCSWMIQEMCHVVQAVELWEQYVCAVTGSSKGLRWSRVSYKGPPLIWATLTREQASSAINGHLNPGGGQHLAPGPLLFRKKSLEAWTSEVFFGTKLNLCLCDLVSLYSTVIRNENVSFNMFEI